MMGSIMYIVLYAQSCFSASQGKSIAPSSSLAQPTDAGRGLAKDKAVIYFYRDNRLICNSLSEKKDPCLKFMQYPLQNLLYSHQALFK